MFTKITLIGSVALLSMLPERAQAEHLLGRYNCGVPAEGVIFKNDPAPCGEAYTIPPRSMLVIDQDGAVANDGSAACATYFFTTRVGNSNMKLGQTQELCNNMRLGTAWTNSSDKSVVVWISVRLNTWVDRGVAAGRFLTVQIP